MLPNRIVMVDENGLPKTGGAFEKIDATSEEAKKRAEHHWDEIISANAASVADALREAGLIGPDSTLRVLGRQVDACDVVFAEVLDREGDDEVKSERWREPRRLVLLEDKLLRNRQAKREVLAQLFDYAHRAQATWTASKLKQWLPAHAEWIGRNESYINRILSQGDLLLVIAGDDIDQDLLGFARHFAGHAHDASLNELALVAMALYRRGNETLLIPHVVSSVERHHRRLAVRVTLRNAAGDSVPADVVAELEDDTQLVERAALPVDPDVRAFLRRAKSILDPILLSRRYETTKQPRKSLAYWFKEESGGAGWFKVHFGGFDSAVWTPIQVGLQVEKTSSVNT